MAVGRSKGHPTDLALGWRCLEWSDCPIWNGHHDFTAGSRPGSLVGRLGSELQSTDSDGACGLKSHLVRWTSAFSQPVATNLSSLKLSSADEPEDRDGLVSISSGILTLVYWLEFPRKGRNLPRPVSLSHCHGNTLRLALRTWRTLKTATVTTSRGCGGHWTWKHSALAGPTIVTVTHGTGTPTCQWRRTSASALRVPYSQCQSL